MRSSGTLLIVLSAIAFGVMPVLGTVAYDDGASVGTLLAVRFVLAAVIWWAVLIGTRRSGSTARSLSGRDVALALALGALGYAGQAGGYFTALERVDASVLSLLVYTYPAIVTAAAVALGRERFSPRRLIALALASSGLVFIVAGAGTGSLDPLGAALGIGVAVIYAAYIITSEGISARMEPRVLATLVCTGAAVTLTAGAAVLGELRLGGVGAAGWASLVTIAVVSTVAAVALFFAGLRRVGPTTAAIVSTVEPLVTVLLAFLAFGQVLGPLQMLGGVLMLSGVFVIHARLRGALGRCDGRLATAGTSA